MRPLLAIAQLVLIVFPALAFVGVPTFAAQPFLAKKAPEDCKYCHSIMSKPNKHEGALMGCDNCHAPHGVNTGYPQRLLDKTNALCFQCHDEKALLKGCINDKECSHPVQNHPILAAKDPLFPNREFNCASCHDPHSSYVDHIIRYDYRPNTAYQGVFCAVCHWDHMFSGPRPTPPWR